MFSFRLKTSAWMPLTSLLLTACIQTTPIKPNAENTAPAATPPTALASATPLVTAKTESEREANPTFAAARHAMAAVSLLEAGNDEQAESELKLALAKEADNKLALSLKQQLSEDPVKRFGRESFNYTVKSGETLSQIADRFLGDAFLFPALAKYNGIKASTHVSEGQTLKIPGKKTASTLSAESVKRGTGAISAPASGPSKDEATTITSANNAYQAAQASERSGNLAKALDSYKLAATAGHPDAPGKVEFVQKKLSSIHSRAARSALARQNLDLALQEWDQVLQLNPNDETAQLERQKVLRLKDAFQNK
jgi:tetratricopeptide (TPR) repeat protein